MSRNPFAGIHSEAGRPSRRCGSEAARITAPSRVPRGWSAERASCADLSEGLSDATIHCLRPAPRQRYQSAVEKKARADVSRHYVLICFEGDMLFDAKSVFLFT